MHIPFDTGSYDSSSLLIKTISASSKADVFGFHQSFLVCLCTTCKMNLGSALLGFSGDSHVPLQLMLCVRMKLITKSY